MIKILPFGVTLICGILLGVGAYHVCVDHQLKKLQNGRSGFTEEDSLKNKVWHGDVDAYTKLHGRYRDYPPEDFLFWAMFMANKYDYAYAYEDVFTTMQEVYADADSAIFKMDGKTRTFALGYLKMAVQKGDSDAANLLSDLKRKHVPDEWLK
ncbi:MAG: hypothetical protein JSS82_10700 [Bacteroidetes bacterium]|nr:hypothetical protein [Bacteroidota bacterium]